MKHKKSESGSVPEHTIPGGHPFVPEPDFDGHTSFNTLTFTQKLAWLSEAVESVYILAENNPDAGCNIFFSTGIP